MLNTLDDSMVRTFGYIYIESFQRKIGLQASRFSLYKAGHIGERKKDEHVLASAP
jgi:hypothetical protein